MRLEKFKPTGLNVPSSPGQKIDKPIEVNRAIMQAYVARRERTCGVGCK